MDIPIIVARIQLVTAIDVAIIDLLHPLYIYSPESLNMNIMLTQSDCYTLWSKTKVKVEKKR